jgi:hypothetical protein
MGECFSRYGEEYNQYSEKEMVYDILSEYINPSEAVGHTYYKGVVRKPEPSSLFNMDRMVEDMQEQAYDEYGEWAEDFAVRQSFRELELLIGDWLDKNVSISFFAVEDVEQREITKEMVEEFLEGR